MSVDTDQKQQDGQLHDSSSESNAQRNSNVSRSDLNLLSSHNRNPPPSQTNVRAQSNPAQPNDDTTVVMDEPNNDDGELQGQPVRRRRQQVNEDEEEQDTDPDEDEEEELPLPPNQRMLDAMLQMTKVVADMAKNMQQTASNNREAADPCQMDKKFHGDCRQTLPFLYAIDNFIKVNGITDAKIQFKKVSKALDAAILSQYFDHHGNVNEYTVQSLKLFLIQQYKPPFSKFHFIQRLESIELRYNEDPEKVFRRFRTLQSRIDRAIDLCNIGVPAAKREKPLTAEQVVNALKGIYIRKNDCEWKGNDGVLNKAVKRIIAKADPASYQDWKKVLKGINTKITPKVLESDPQYRIHQYPATESETNIFIKNNRSKNKNGNGNGNGHTKTHTATKRRVPNEFGDAASSAAKRHKGKRCAKCGRHNHTTKQCEAHKTCTKCGLKGHTAIRCRNNRGHKGSGPPRKQPKTIMRDGKPFRGNCFNCGGTGHQTKDCVKPKRPGNGHEKTAMDSSQDACRRCLYPGHLEKDCYAKYTANGDLIQSPSIARMRDMLMMHGSHHSNNTNANANTNANSSTDTNANDNRSFQTKSYAKSHRHQGKNSKITAQCNAMYKSLANMDGLGNDQKEELLEKMKNIREILDDTTSSPRQFE